MSKSQPIPLSAKQQEWLEARKEEIRKEIIPGISTHIKRLGEILVEAENEMPGKVYKELVEFLRVSCGWTAADIDAAKGIAEGNLDAKLFFVGVSSRKALNLPKDEAERLLTNEKFPIYRDDGTEAKLPWHSMTPTEKNRLLGARGTSILALTQQDQPQGKGNNKTYKQYDQGRIDEEILVLHKGTKEGRIDTRKLKASLRQRGELQTLIDLMSADDEDEEADEPSELKVAAV